MLAVEVVEAADDVPAACEAVVAAAADVEPDEPDSSRYPQAERPTTIEQAISTFEGSIEAESRLCMIPLWNNCLGKRPLKASVCIWIDPSAVVE